MWPIIYRIFVPGILVAILAGRLAFSQFYSYKKHKKIDGRKKNASIAFLTIALLGAALAGYNSMDLILKDYITQQGIYDSYNRGREVYILELFFSVDNSDEFCYAFTWDVDNLEIGKKYQFTHSKRTNMLLSVEEIDF